MCPPLEEARAAVQARVGEVRGDYHAEFALIRGDDGQPALSLSLRDGPAEVLRRELPIDGAGCQDAAQAIALVLERYFDAIEAPAASLPAPVLESVPVAVAAPAATRDTNETPRVSRPNQRGLQVGAVFDAELGAGVSLGASYYPDWGRWRANWRWGIVLQLAPFLSRQHESVRYGQIEAFSLQSALYAPLTWQPSWWSVSVGPWAQLRLQRAEATELMRARTAYRALPGLGGLGQVAINGGTAWRLSAGVAAGAQLRGAASSFVLERDTGPFEVLVPQAWFGQALVSFELRL